MHRPQILKYNNFQLQPMTPNMERKRQIFVNGIYQIFSDADVYGQNLSTKISSKAEAEQRLAYSIQSNIHQTSWDYFLIDLQNDQVVGVITVVSPKIVKQIYPFAQYFGKAKKYADNLWSLEYYLARDYRNKGHMSYWVSNLLGVLQNQGVPIVLALTKISNINSQNLLKRLNFSPCKDYQDHDSQELWLKELL